jgi:hypothetical protein
MDVKVLKDEERRDVALGFTLYEAAEGISATYSDDKKLVAGANCLFAVAAALMEESEEALIELSQFASRLAKKRLARRGTRFDDHPRYLT